jgi:hypothetical protein
MQVLSDVISTGNNEIHIDSEGILRVKAIKEGEIDLAEVQRCFNIYKELGCTERKALQLLDLSLSVTISKEARDYTDKMAPDYFVASAVVSDSLAVRIIVNFCVRFFNPAIPLKMFDTEKEALAWLRKFRP